jgi:hypothetical protein
MEMIDVTQQRALDQYLEKKISWGMFARTTGFESGWGKTSPAYKRILEWSRKNGVAVLGLNAPQSVTRKIARNQKLTATEAALVPTFPEPGGFKKFQAAMADHPGSRSGRQYYEAQRAWDTTMAETILSWLRKHQGTLVVLLGQIHADPQTGVLWYVARNSDLSQLIIYWRHLLPTLARALPEAAQLASARVDDVVSALHRVEPGLIRVGADQTTYNLHVVIRVEIERALIGGQLPVASLPEAWSAAYEKHLGIRPRNDFEGCLQDGHWASAMFGYLPTYSIGNLIAAQLFAAARRDIERDRGKGALDDAFARGDVTPLRAWLATKVHARAGLANAAQIVLDATGAPLSPDAFLAELDANASRRAS